VPKKLVVFGCSLGSKGVTTDGVMLNRFCVFFYSSGFLIGTALSVGAKRLVVFGFCANIVSL
jgi:hypothetical protein